MWMRTVVGACAGIFAAVGWHLTWRRSLSPYCTGDTDWGCGVSRIAVPAVYGAGWAIAGGLFLVVALRLLRLRDAGMALVLGCFFWPFAALGLALLGLLESEGGGMAVPIIAFAVAGAVTGRGWSR